MRSWSADFRDAKSEEATRHVGSPTSPGQVRGENVPTGSIVDQPSIVPFATGVVAVSGRGPTHDLQASNRAADRAR